MVDVLRPALKGNETHQEKQDESYGRGFHIYAFHRR
jgi:hypothetical protein